MNGHTMQRRFAESVVERTPAVLLPAVRDRVDPQRAHDRRETADVIAVRVRVHEQVYASHAFAQQVRQDDAFADDLRRGLAAHARAAFEPAAAVDQDHVAARRANHDPVALADVEHRDRQLAVGEAQGRQQHAGAREHDHGDRDTRAAPERHRGDDREHVVRDDGRRRRRRDADVRARQRGDAADHAQDRVDVPGGDRRRCAAD